MPLGDFTYTYRYALGVTVGQMSPPMYRLTGTLSAVAGDAQMPVLTSIPAKAAVVPCGEPTRSGLVEIRYCSATYRVLWDHLCLHTSVP